MKDLKLVCDSIDNDFIELEEIENIRIAIDIIEDGNRSRVVLKKDKANQLRDWLNEFLGENK